MATYNSFAELWLALRGIISSNYESNHDMTVITDWWLYGSSRTEGGRNDNAQISEIQN